MQALVLVGGEGTRLRPLTETVPKPALPLVGRPFISYMLDWLRRHGVDDVILACGFLPDALREAIGDGDRGPAGSLRRRARAAGNRRRHPLAADLLDDRFLALNGDVLADLDLSALVAQHERAGAPRPSACTRWTTRPATASSDATRRAAR